MGLDDSSEWQGLDTAILPGNSQKEFSIHAIALAAAEAAAVEVSRAMLL
jgi:hypothetical protein